MSPELKRKRFLIYFRKSENVHLNTVRVQAWIHFESRLGLRAISYLTYSVSTKGLVQPILNTSHYLIIY